MAVRLLLHLDGADASTTFTDEFRHVFTAAGNAQIDTAQSQFGGASLLLDGTGDYISTPSSDDFAYGTGDFTWECWLRLAVTTGVQYIIEHGTNGGSLIYNGSLGGLRYYNTTTGTGSALYTTSIPLVVDTWYHLAVARQAGTTRLFVDGVLKASGADSHNYAAQALRIGEYGTGGTAVNGHIDEVRIDKGRALYTAAFTPPTAAFTDHPGMSDSAAAFGGEFPVALPATSNSALALGGEFPVYTEYSLALALRQRVQSHLTLPLRQRVVARPYVLGLPLRQRVALPSTILTLPLRQRVVAPSAVLALPLRQRVASATVLTLPLRQRARATGIVTGAATQRITYTVLLGGVDVSAALTGAADIDREEGMAATAHFTLRPFAGPIDLVTWLGAPVQIAMALEGGTPQVEFTGLVSDPSYDPQTRLTTFACTDGLQAVLDGAPPAVVDAIAGGYWSDALFRADSTGWQRAQDRLSTIPESLDRSPLGALRRTPWLAKATPDFTFTEAGIVDGSLRAEPGPWRGQINRIDLIFEARYQRRLHREKHYRWVYPGGFEAYIVDSSSMPTEDDIRRAGQASGWQVVYEYFVRFPPSGVYNGLAWIHNPDQPPFFVTEANLIGARRWTETVTETYRYTVTAPASIARFGEHRREEYVSLAPDAPAIAWDEVLLPLRDGGISFGPTDLSGALTAPNGDRYFDDLDTADFDAGVIAALARADTAIRGAHRGNTVAITVPLLPGIDLTHTARVETATVTAQGKVRQIVHSLPLSGEAEATTTLRIAVSQAADVAVTASPIAAPPRLVTAPPALSGGLSLGLGGDDTHLAGRWYSEQPQDPDWIGWVGNYGLLIPYNAETYDESFTIDWGEIPREPTQATRDLPHTVAIPHELLEIAA